MNYGHIGELDRGYPGQLTYGLASCEICDVLDAFLAPITHHYQYLLPAPKPNPNKSCQTLQN